MPYFLADFRHNGRAAVRRQVLQGEINLNLIKDNFFKVIHRHSNFFL